MSNAIESLSGLEEILEEVYGRDYVLIEIRPAFSLGIGRGQRGLILFFTVVFTLIGFGIGYILGEMFIPHSAFNPGGWLGWILVGLLNWGFSGLVLAATSLVFLLLGYIVGNLVSHHPKFLRLNIAIDLENPNPDAEFYRLAIQPDEEGYQLNEEGLSVLFRDMSEYIKRSLGPYLGKRVIVIHADVADPIAQLILIHFQNFISRRWLNRSLIAIFSILMDVRNTYEGIVENELRIVNDFLSLMIPVVVYEPLYDGLNSIPVEEFVNLAAEIPPSISRLRRYLSGEGYLEGVLAVPSVHSYHIPSTPSLADHIKESVSIALLEGVWGRYNSEEISMVYSLVLRPWSRTPISALIKTFTGKVEPEEEQSKEIYLTHVKTSLEGLIAPNRKLMIEVEGQESDLEEIKIFLIFNSAHALREDRRLSASSILHT